MIKIELLRIDSTGKKNIEDVVCEETPLTIYLEEKELLTLLCSPHDLKELCIGFLYSSRLIKSLDDIKNIIIDRQNWNANIELNKKMGNNKLMFKRLYTSGCGKGTVFYNALDCIHKIKITSDARISSEKIVALMDCFQASSLGFKETGGVHSAALSSGDDILVFKEDIGRHNALDKVIGEALVKNLNMKDSIILTSGRISSEIISKAESARASFLISRSAPTDQAIKLAKELNLTLIGFVRGKRMNVYTANERVT